MTGFYPWIRSLFSELIRDLDFKFVFLLVFFKVREIYFFYFIFYADKKQSR